MTTNGLYTILSCEFWAEHSLENVLVFMHHEQMFLVDLVRLVVHVFSRRDYN